MLIAWPVDGLGEFGGENADSRCEELVEDKTSSILMRE
jgi:hypothetical protein